MTEGRNAAVIPFVREEEDEAEMHENNPAQRLFLAEAVRMAEAIVFASAEPVGEKQLAARLPDGIDVAAVMSQLGAIYERRGVNLVKVGEGWAFRTAGDLAFLMSRDQVQQKKLSRAALEVLSIIAYHQPVTRAEIEDIRGVETSKGTLDTLLETEWVRMRGRRKSPGRPVTYGTTRPLPRPLPARGDPRPTRNGGAQGRRAVVGAHADQLRHAGAANRSGPVDRGRGPADRHRPRGARPVDTAARG